MEPKHGRDLSDAAKQIADSFESAFGQTPLNERINDIVRQAASLARFHDFANLRDEAGDLLCSVLQLSRECGWIPEQLIEATLNKIAARAEIYRRLGRKLRVALYRGVFDPIHVGHLEVAKDILREGALDEVWLVPSYAPSGEPARASAEERLEMCRLAVQGQPGLSVFDFEIQHRFQGEVYHFVKKLLASDLARERCDFSLILAQDKADTLASWTNYDGLERLADFVVIPVKGAAPPRLDAWYLRPPHRFLEKVRWEELISSQEIQRLLEVRENAASKYLLPEVHAYILQHRLYEDHQQRSPRATQRKVAIYHRSFDPPSKYHRQQVEMLLRSGFDEVVICPQVSGLLAGEQEHASPLHRAALLALAFQDMTDVVVDYEDLNFNQPSSAVSLETRHRGRGELWHVVDRQLIQHGANGRAAIQRQWSDGTRLWHELGFVVLYPESDPPVPEDLPKRHRLMVCSVHPSSADLRARLYQGISLEDQLAERVQRYVERHRLFVSNSFQRRARFRLGKPRLRIVANTKNERSMALARHYAEYESSSPDLILVLGGDGTMLHAIREHWRLRVPFIGLNTGHLGFLMNESLPVELLDLELVSYSLPMLRVDAREVDGTSSSGMGFSDVWVERCEGQSAWLRLDIDGETRANKIVGDGMLVATAAGSSAYARAMGAVPVPLNTSVLALVGSNIFQPRFWKPMAISDESLIRIVNLDETGKRPVRGFIDGIAMGVVQEITVRRSLTAGVEMAFTREFDPSTRLLRSLFPADET
jgi:NAD+ kinase